MTDGASGDVALVRRMLAGDEEAFGRFFEASYPAVYRFALARLAGDREAAADVAQTTICKAIGKLHTFRGEAALLTWLCTFCRHELYHRERQHQRRAQVDLLEDDPEIRAALESLRTAADLEAALDRDRLASIVQRALDCVPARYASALEWKYIDGLTVKEIADRLGVGTKAAESLLTRARSTFRDAFRTIAPAWPGLDS